MGNSLKTSTKSHLIRLGLTPAPSGRDAAIYKKMLGSGMQPSNLAKQTALIIT